MPQTESARKALRASQRRRVKNDSWRRKFRASIKSVRQAVTLGDVKTAVELLKIAQKNIDRAARHHVLPANTAARKKSRLQKAVTNMSKK